ncbi:MAG: hypothetical protein JWQ59_743 [Cryobacterium sp.]|jgi:hypothetical protein|nr:hypothetical protein [Cryobacterium sp.]
MKAPRDPYRDWDAAYVLGALSPEERREYEGHLAECRACSAAVAELAGIPGLLSGLDIDAVEPDATPADRGPADLLPRLVEAARRSRRRTQVIVVGAFVAVAAAAAALALVLPAALGWGGGTDGQRADGSTTPTAAPSEMQPPGSSAAELVVMQKVVPSPLSADFRLAAQPWGTRIESHCSYARPQEGGPRYAVGEQAYAMYVTDRTGVPSLVATWAAGPGATVAPVGTTNLAPGEIVRVDIRSLANGQVLLASSIEP